MDKSIRQFVKSTFHHPKPIPNALLYTDRRRGGLDIPCITYKIPAIRLSRIRNLEQHEDHQLSTACSNGYVIELKERLFQILTNIGHNPNTQRIFWRNKLQHCFSGAGRPNHSDCSYPSGWIQTPPPMWSGRDYIAAVQLRTNTLSTRGGLHNVRLPPEQKNYRAGCQRRETICHVLQKCPLINFERIRRHDHACNQLSNFASREGWIVETEPHIRCSDGLLEKTDLLLHKDGSVIIVDVSIN